MVCVSASQAAPSPAPPTSPFWGPEQEEEEQSHRGTDGRHDSDDDDAASLQSIALANDSRQGDDGEHYQVVPQPVTAPRMVRPG